MNEVEWTCPHCAVDPAKVDEAKNVDWMAETAYPMCGGCSRTFLWSEVLAC